MQLNKNSVVRYTTPSMVTKYGVVVSYGQTYDGKPEVFATVYFGDGYLELSIGLLTPITNSYVGVGMDTFEVYNDFREQFNKALEGIEEEANRRAHQFSQTIKPQLKTKTFNFKSVYTPCGLTIKVVKTPGKPHDIISINDQVLNNNEIRALNDIVNQTIAGMQIANTTIKIGEVIGDTDTLRKALQFYHA